MLSARGGDQEQRSPSTSPASSCSPCSPAAPRPNSARRWGVGTASSARALGLCTAEAPPPTRRACATAWTGCSPISPSSTPRGPGAGRRALGRPAVPQLAGRLRPPRGRTARCCSSSPTGPTNSPRPPRRSAACPAAPATARSTWTAHRGRDRPLVRDPVGEHADDASAASAGPSPRGNPFEAVELAAKVRDRGLTPEGASAHLLRDLAAAVKGRGLISRLERLGPSTVRLAWAAAVLGTEIPPALAAAVAGLGSQEAPTARERLREARILTGEPHPGVRPPADRHRRLPGDTRRRTGRPARQGRLVGGGRRARPRRRRPPPAGDPPRGGPVGRAPTARAPPATCCAPERPEAARSYLARALREPPAHEDRAAVLFELGCSTQLMEPATTVNHLRAALDEPIHDPDPARQHPLPALPVARAQRPAQRGRRGRRPGRAHRDQSPAPGCGCRPSSSCGTPSAPTSRTRPAGPAGWPGSPTGSPAATSPSATSSGCAPGTPPCAASPPPPRCTTRRAPWTAACRWATRTAASRCRCWSP